MRIYQLPTLTNLPDAGDLIPVSSGSQDFVIDYEALASAILTQFSATFGGKTQNLVDALEYETATLSLTSGVFADGASFTGNVYRFGRIGLIAYRVTGLPAHMDTTMRSMITLPSAFAAAAPEYINHVSLAGNPYRIYLSGTDININTLGAEYTANTEFAGVIPYIVA